MLLLLIEIAGFLFFYLSHRSRMLLVKKPFFLPPFLKIYFKFHFFLFFLTFSPSWFCLFLCLEHGHYNIYIYIRLDSLLFLSVFHAQPTKYCFQLVCHSCVCRPSWASARHIQVRQLAHTKKTKCVAYRGVSFPLFLFFFCVEMACKFLEFPAFLLATPLRPSHNSKRRTPEENLPFKSNGTAWDPRSIYHTFIAHSARKPNSTRFFCFVCDFSVWKNQRQLFFFLWPFSDGSGWGGTKFVRVV